MLTRRECARLLCRFAYVCIDLSGGVAELEPEGVRLTHPVTSHSSHASAMLVVSLRQAKLPIQMLALAFSECARKKEGRTKSYSHLLCEREMPPRCCFRAPPVQRALWAESESFLG